MAKCVCERKMLQEKKGKIRVGEVSMAEDILAISEHNQCKLGLYKVSIA